MVATLQSSVGKMNDLLARLAQHNKGRSDERVPVALGALLEAVVNEKKLSHPIELFLESDGLIVGDLQRLEQIFVHLLPNAIDASPPDVPVAVALAPGVAPLGSASCRVRVGQYV